MTVKGPANQGNAGVLGGSVNPINLYMQAQRARAQQDYLQQQEIKKKRDSVFEYVGQYNPEAKWEPFNAEVNNMAQTHVRDWAKDQMNQGKDPNQIQSELAYRRGMVDNYAKETGTWKEAHDRAYTAIKGDAKYNPEAVTALHDLFFQPNGRPQPKEFIRNNLAGVDNLLYDPSLMNTSVVVKKFMDTLNEQSQKTWGTLQKPDGTYLTSEEIASKLPYLRDARGTPVIDPHTQQPIPIINDNLYTLAMGSQDLRLKMQKEGGDTRAEQEKWLAKVLPGQDKVKTQSEIKEGFKKTSEDDRRSWRSWGWGYDVDPKDLGSRYEMLKTVTDKYTPETLGVMNHLTKDVKVQYGKLNGKGDPQELLLSYPTHAEEIPANETPEQKAQRERDNRFATPAPIHIKTVSLPLTTPKERQEARVQLSEHLDQFDQKRSLGDQYEKYEREMLHRAATGKVKMTGSKDIGF